MKIAVVGAGAIGSLYGALLFEAGHDVHLISTNRDYVAAVNGEGLAISSGSGQRTLKIPAHITPENTGPVDIVLVSVKAHSTASAARTSLSLAGSNTLVLTIQNGIGNMEQLGEALGTGRVMAGTTSFGANMVKPGYVRHAGSGATVLGEIDGAITTRLELLAGIMEEAGLNPRISANIQGELWTKLIVNAGINALTAIARVRNGALLEVPSLERILELSVAEAAEVARRKGVQLTCGDPPDHVKNIARATGENVSSMLADVRRGKRTEVDMINGAIVREGERLGLQTPVNLFLTQLMESIYTVNERNLIV